MNRGTAAYIEAWKALGPGRCKVRLSRVDEASSRCDSRINSEQSRLWGVNMGPTLDPTSSLSSQFPTVSAKHSQAMWSVRGRQDWNPSVQPSLYLQPI